MSIGLASGPPVAEIVAASSFGGLFRSQLPVHSPLALRAVAAAITAVLRHRQDPRVELEALLMRRFHADTATLCGSGTDALQLAIRLAMLQAGADVVALPAFSCFDVASAAIASGARVCFYDIDPETLGPDLHSLRLALGRAGVAVFSPLYGLPVDWSAIERVCAESGVLAIEDSAQGAGARWNDRLLGSLGRLSVLSFGRGKGWTGGAGGALLRRGFDDAESALLAGAVPPTADAVVIAGAFVQLALGRPELYRLPRSLPFLNLGETVWHDAPPPRPMTRAAAAIALGTAAAAEHENDRRAAAGAVLVERVAAIPGLRPVVPPPGAAPTFLRFPLLRDGGFAGLPDPLVARRLGIAPSYPLPLPALDQLGDASIDRGRHFAGADRLAHALLTLPTHGRVTAAETEQMLQLLYTSPTRPGGRS